MTGAPPKVFVSYSHDTVEHQERVLGLADRLRADGVDAEIDQYNASPLEGWPLWCEQQIDAADVVLMICTETYHRRVSGDEERGKGLGVVWEARIIRQLLYDAGAVSDKFVPVLFSDCSSEYIPTPIKGGTRYVVDTEDGYEDFYRRLAGQPRLLRPALGTIRPLPTRRRQWPEGTMESASSSLALASAPAPDHAGSGRRGTPVRKLWWFLRQEKNRQVLGWFGGGPLSSQVAFGPWLPSSTHPISPLRRRMSMLRRRGASAPVGISRLDDYGSPASTARPSPSNPTRAPDASPLYASRCISVF
jgi:SEFIR domain-containing protein